MLGETTPPVLSAEALHRHVATFNQHDHTHFGQAVSNEDAAKWMEDNVPRFDCPDKEIEEIYHFRWWTFRKHIKETPDGFIITEFLPKVSWSGKHNAINCPAGHHYREGRWIRDPKYLNDYSVFWFRKGGNPRAYSFWAADSIHQRALVLGDFTLAVDLLPDLVANYQEWEKKKLCPDGLFWQIDDRDGMEVSIGGSGKRATINSYMYGDARAIAAIARVAGKRDIEKEYTAKAENLRKLVNGVLWDKEALFYKTLPYSKNDGNAAKETALVDVRELAWFHSMVFPSSRTGQGLRDRMETVDGYQGLQGALRPHHRRATASAVQGFLRRSRMPVERTELAVRHLRHAHRACQRAQRLPAAGNLPRGLFRNPQDLCQIPPPQAGRWRRRPVDR